MITKEGILNYLGSPLSVFVLDECESTNLTARKLAEEVVGNALIVARRQSGGRGRMGRSFFSPNGGLYMSLLLQEPMPAKKALSITTAASVAAARAIEKVSGRACGIKWVNDIYIDGRKVCGILTESKIKEGMLEYAVLGIGVNLTAPEGGFPEDIRNRAGAVFYELQHDEGDRLCSLIVNEFMTLYNSGLDTARYIEEYRRRSVIIDREIDVIDLASGETKTATAVNIDDDCSLVVRYPDGSTEVLSSGDVSIRGTF